MIEGTTVEHTVWVTSPTPSLVRSGTCDKLFTLLGALTFTSHGAVVRIKLSGMKAEGQVCGRKNPEGVGKEGRGGDSNHKQGAMLNACESVIMKTRIYIPTKMLIF